jgi:hypothetical protein
VTDLHNPNVEGGDTAETYTELILQNVYTINFKGLDRKGLMVKMMATN